MQELISEFIKIEAYRMLLGKNPSLDVGRRLKERQKEILDLLFKMIEDDHYDY